MHLINENQIIEIGKDENIIVNLITGESDVINDEIKALLQDENFDQIDTDIMDILKERSYVFNTLEEKNKFESDIRNKLNELELREAPNFLFIPTYGCNLSCTYCFEQKYDLDSTIRKEEKRDVYDKMMASVKKICNEKEKEYNLKYNKEDINITLMGGEPLLYSNKESVEYILRKIYEEGYSSNIITNGVDLDKFVDVIKKYEVNSIQVTLDGTRKKHDEKRIFKDGSGSFDIIFENVKMCMEKGIKTFIRVNVDNQNMDHLPELAREINDAFGDDPNLISYIYLLQDGGCSGNKNIIDEISAIQKIIKIEEEYPEVKRFVKTFHGKNLVDNVFYNKDFTPATRSCAASKNQYILDHKGDVYKCWFGIGNPNYKIGEFSSDVNIDKNKDFLWKNRTVFNVSECKECKYRYVCGGGCVGRTVTNEFKMEAGNCAEFDKIFEHLFKDEYAKLQKGIN